MPAAKDDDHLGLSLSLSCSKTVNNFREIPTSNKDNNPTGMNHFFQMASPSVPPPHQVPLQLNLMMMPSSSSSSSAVSNSSRFLTRNQLGAASLFQKSSTSMWNNSTTNLVHPYTSTDRASDSSPGVATATTDSKFTGSADPRSFLKGIDVNRLPSSNNVADEDDVGVSSPNSTLSSVSGKRSERETAAHNTNNFPTGSGDERTYSRGGGCGGSDDEDGEAARKKLRLSKDQSAVLEESFKEHNTLNPKQKQALAKRLGLRPRQVEVWFQNRRARTKLKQTEVDCEFLKRCCEQLTEENRRLQKEVQELRTLKLSPQFYMQMTPPTTLTMCPSCERVGSGGAGGGVHTPARPMLVPSNNNSTEAPSSAKHHRSGRVAASGGMTMNPWSLTAPSVPIRSYDALQPRS